MSRTFELGGSINTSLATRTIDIVEQMKKVLGGPIEQACQLHSPLLAWTSSNLAGLAHEAFSEHRHMILDPDSVWLTIEHGLANHIKQNAEKLRSKFVDFNGKTLIELQRDEFVRGKVNDWEGCFDEFSEKIGEFIGAKRDLIVSKFSTTGLLQRVSSEIVLMDAMSKYFDYGVSTLCHIPMITIEGTVEDWENIRDRVNSFDEFELSWWTDHLKPVLDQLVLSSKGEIDIGFWKSWYKEGGGSGGPFITGHINALFPYVGKESKRNEYMGKTYYRFGFGNTLASFTKSISQVPFVWSYYGTKYPMEFAGGIVGLTQNDKGAIRCAFGWSVRDEAVPLTNYAMERLTKDMIIHDKNGKAGKLKRAEAEHWDHNPKARELYEIQIEFEDGELKTYNKYELNRLFVKTPASGEEIYRTPEQK
jgi:hypothetical protein